jgi:hypothetical protein
MITTTCPHKCDGGGKCNCNGAVAHDHHICRDPGCECHQAAAYGVEMVTQRNGRESYIPTGARLVGEAKP